LLGLQPGNRGIDAPGERQLATTIGSSKRENARILRNLRQIWLNVSPEQLEITRAPPAVSLSENTRPSCERRGRSRGEKLTSRLAGACWLERTPWLLRTWGPQPV